MFHGEYLGLRLSSSGLEQVKHMKQTRRDVVEAWLRDDSTWIDLIPTFTDDPAEGWATLCDLVEAAPDDENLRFLGASALEEFLKMCGEEYVSEVEAYAAKTSKFRVALESVWLPARNPSPATKRLLALGCKPIDVAPA